VRLERRREAPRPRGGDGLDRGIVQPGSGAARRSKRKREKGGPPEVLGKPPFIHLTSIPIRRTSERRPKAYAACSSRILQSRQ
jgi:hypothetical protein